MFRWLAIRIRERKVIPARWAIVCLTDRQHFRASSRYSSVNNREISPSCPSLLGVSSSRDRLEIERANKTPDLFDSPFSRSNSPLFGATRTFSRWLQIRERCFVELPQRCLSDPCAQTALRVRIAANSKIGSTKRERSNS